MLKRFLCFRLPAVTATVSSTCQQLYARITFWEAEKGNDIAQRRASELEQHLSVTISFLNLFLCTNSLARLPFS
jgi:hypothetical protein